MRKVVVAARFVIDPMAPPSLLPYGRIEGLAILFELLARGLLMNYCFLADLFGLVLYSYAFAASLVLTIVALVELNVFSKF